MAGSVPDLPGVHAPPHGARDIMMDVMNLLRRSSIGFPGAQPVSFTVKHLQELFDEDYFVCEKSDGLRCLMFLSSVEDGAGGREERTYLITRKSEVSWIQGFHIPRSMAELDRFHDGTLIDGELVRTQPNAANPGHPSEGKLRYFMFDMIAENGRILANRDLTKRLGHLNQNVAMPFDRLVRKFPEDVRSFPFKIYMKPMSESYRLPRVLETHRDHLSDGLIFTSVKAPYKFGTDDKILKWKPAEENSVDFALRLDFPIVTGDDDDPDSFCDYDAKPTVVLLAWHGRTDQPFAELPLSDAEWDDLKALDEPLNYRIGECSRDSSGRWRLLRFRDDKEHGNNIDVARSVIESIEDGVTAEFLSSQAPEMERRWLERHPELRRAKRPAHEEGQPPKRPAPEMGHRSPTAPNKESSTSTAPIAEPQSEQV